MQKMTRKLEIHKTSQTQTNCEVQRDDSFVKEKLRKYEKIDPSTDNSSKQFLRNKT